MKVLMLAIFIGWLLISIRGMFNRETVYLKDIAQKEGKDLEQVKNSWTAMILPTLILVCGLYIWAATVINTPLVIIGSAIAIVSNTYQSSRATKAIENGEIKTGPSIYGVYSILLKCYIVYELVRMIINN